MKSKIAYCLLLVSYLMSQATVDAKLNLVPDQKFSIKNTEDISVILKPEFKQRLKVTSKGRVTKTPKVKDCKDFCFFKNEDNYWCYVADPPVFRAGWRFVQTFGNPSSGNAVKYWQFEFQPFYQAEIYVEQNFLIQMIYGHQAILSIPQYMVNFFYSIILNGSKQYCIGYGTRNQQIQIEVIGQHTFLECYKTLINTLFDESDIYKGFEAKYFDQCQQSVASQVDVRTWNYKDPSDQYATSYGSTDPTSATFCKALPVIGSAASNSAQKTFYVNAYEKIFEYALRFKGSNQETTSRDYTIL